MNCAQRNCVYAIIVLLLCVSGITATAKDNVKSVEIIPIEKFQWHEHTKLSWDDFRGAASSTHNESAAATCCSIGFRTNTTADSGRLYIEVYNTFYVNKSWVREDARIQSILDHEQGHFDLCEVYTRQLKARLGKIDLNGHDVKQQLMKIYGEVSAAYEARQQAYEEETTHGTILPEQRKWQDMIAAELKGNSALASNK